MKKIVTFQILMLLGYIIQANSLSLLKVNIDSIGGTTDTIASTLIADSSNGGCTDTMALNWLSFDANIDNGSCI